MRSGRSRARDSYIVRFFTFLTNFVYHMISAGFIGRVFTSYTKVDRVFRASRVGRLSTATERSGGRLHRAIRRNIAIAMNQSMISGGVKALFRLLCQCSLRTFGLFFVTSGSYSAIMYWLFSVIWQNGRVEVLNLFSGIAALILGIMLLFSDASLGYALSKGLFFQKILIEVFGVSDDALCDVPQLGKQGHVIAVPLGMVIGAVSALTSPIYLLVGALAFLLLALVLSVPEAGVLLLILFVPFAGFLPHSAYWIAFLVAVPLVAYLGKLLRGNRAFHMEVQDLPVLLMLVLFVLSGFSVAGKGAFAGALLSALLVGFYFLVVNVIATSRWLDRCRVALIVSATAASLLGIVQFIYAAAWSTNGADANPWRTRVRRLCRSHHLCLLPCACLPVCALSLCRREKAISLTGRLCDDHRDRRVRADVGTKRLGRDAFDADHVFAAVHQKRLPVCFGGWRVNACFDRCFARSRAKGISFHAQHRFRNRHCA